MRSVLFDVLEINIVATLVIVLLCLLAGKIRKNYGAAWLKLMWLVLIVRMLIPYNFSLPTTEFRLFSTPGFEQEADVTSDGTIEIISEEAIQENPQPSVSLDDESGTEMHEQVVSEPNLFVPEAYEEGNLQNKSSFRYTDILLYVWIAGIAVTGLYHLVIYVMLRQNYLRGLQPVHNEHLQAQITSLQIKYLGKVKLTAYESDKVDTPLLTGLLHPKLIIPVTKSEWNAEELELVIAHELCHYRMKDLWLKQLMLLVTCVNWFNPAVYLMKKHFYHDMELVCDAHVMRGRSNDEKEAYAKILMSYAGKNRRNYTFMSGLAAGKKLTKNRIQHIWEDGRKKKGVVVFICILVALLGISLFVSCGYKPEEVVKDAGGVSGGVMEPVEDEHVSNGDEEEFVLKETFTDDDITDTDVSDEEDVLLHTMQYELQPGELCQINLYGKAYPNSTYGISYVEIISENGKDYSFATEEAMTEVWGEKTVYTECWKKDGGIKLEDVNFDGYADIGLMARIPAYNLPYIYYFFDAETGKYEYYDFFPMYFTVDAETETCSISHHAGTIYFDEVWGKDNAGGLYLMQQTVRDYDYFTGEFTETTEYYSLDE